MCLQKCFGLPEIDVFSRVFWTPRNRCVLKDALDSQKMMCPQGCFGLPENDVSSRVFWTPRKLCVLKGALDSQKFSMTRLDLKGGLGGKQNTPAEPAVCSKAYAVALIGQGHKCEME